MLYGSVGQFQLYDSLLMSEKNYKIEAMVLEAATALKQHFCTDDSVLIFCGGGNNGADGLALATLLDCVVTVVYLGNIQKASYANRYYLRVCQEKKIPIHFFNEDFSGLDVNFDVIVDGIFGTGFKGKLSEDYCRMIDFINSFKNKKRIISIDCPSGLDGDLGVASNRAIMADKTITFIANKIGYLNPEASKYLGEVVVEQILYDEDVFFKVLMSSLAQRKDLDNLLRERTYNGYKGTYGVLECHVGSKQYPGSALLSVGAAVYTGCGYVHFIGDDSLSMKLVSSYPEIVVHSQNLKSTAVLFGCGKGRNKQTYLELKELIEKCSAPILIDADGINCLSEHLELLKQKHPPIILTPHVGEMRRLCEGECVLSAIDFARRYDVIVVLKGPSTLITDGRRAVRIPSGNKAMAVAGMGDCLAGIIASLLANHYAPFDACRLGAYIHGLCGDELAKSNYTVLPHDLIKSIPFIMKEIEKRAKGH